MEEKNKLYEETKKAYEEFKKDYEDLDWKLYNFSNFLYKARKLAINKMPSTRNDVYNDNLRILENCKFAEIITELGYSIINNSVAGNDIKLSYKYIISNILIKIIDDNILPFDAEENYKILDFSKDILDLINKVSHYKRQFEYERKSYIELEDKETIGEV